MKQRANCGRTQPWWKRFFRRHSECCCQRDDHGEQDSSQLTESAGSAPEDCCRERTLRDARNGERVRIECLRGDEGVCRRLREMGFCESATVEKIAESGALICRVCDAKVVLSRKLAQNIILGENPKGVKMLLSAMAVGQKGIIRRFTVENEDCERVEEMGVTPGEEVEVVRYAPLGDPIEIKIRGYALSLRREEADLIEVEVSS